ANVPPRRSGTRFRQGARAPLFQSSSESGRDMSKIGVHSFVWSAGSSRDALEKALENTHRLGYKLIEFSYLDPSHVDVAWLAGRIRERGLDVAVSMGLPPEGDISSEDASVVANGVAILDRAVALVRDLGGT